LRERPARLCRARERLFGLSGAARTPDRRLRPVAAPVLSAPAATPGPALSVFPRQAPATICTTKPGKKAPQHEKADQRGLLQTPLPESPGWLTISSCITRPCSVIGGRSIRASSVDGAIFCSHADNRCI